jgi:hypothetical protein
LPPKGRLLRRGGKGLDFEGMAGTHLEDALRALRDTGSADALYGHK